MQNTCSDQIKRDILVVAICRNASGDDFYQELNCDAPYTLKDATKFLSSFKPNSRGRSAADCSRKQFLVDHK